MTNPVRNYVEDHAQQLCADLDAWLRIPSVSGDPTRALEVRRSAEWLADALRRTGFPTVEIWDTRSEDGTPGLPAVFAEWPSADPSAPTVAVYGHHDVQPVDPEELWRSPPFEPTVRGEELFARGAIDDKGQVAFHLLGVAAHLAATGRSSPAVHLKMLVEGEEESGSPNFPRLLRDHRERLRCDVVVVSDTGIWDRETPTVCTGMRGLISCQIDLHGPDTDLHSGSFGGAVPNPLHAMADLLAGLHDRNGRVTIEGFYDGVLELGERERDIFARLPYDEAAWLRTAESRAVYGEAGYSTLERIWARPTAEVNGVWGGYTGPGHKTIVPSVAHAKVSFRLVAAQEPLEVQAAVRAHLERAVPAGITATVLFEGPGVRPVLSPVDSPATAAVVVAMEKAFDREVLLMREGGSGPEADLAEVLQAPVVFLGVGLPDDRIHAPNERVVLPMLLKGAEAAAHLWEGLATAARRA